MRKLVDWFKRWIVQTALTELHAEMGDAGAAPDPIPTVPLLEGPKPKKKAR